MRQKMVAVGRGAAADGQQGRRGSAWTVPLLVLGLLAAIAALVPTSALAVSTGLKPSEAPLVTVGQEYFGNTNENGSSEFGPPDFWRLPPLLTGDAITVAWNVAKTDEVEGGPGFCLAQNVDDYDWAESQNYCNASPGYHVASNGSARSVVEVRNPTSAAFMEFRGCGPSCNNATFIGAYSFTVESIQHAIGLSLLNRLHIRTNSVLWATADLSSGAPVPDGLTFTLNASWPSNGSAQYTATSVNGGVSFLLALPPETEGQNVSLAVSRPADPQFLEATSAALSVKVARPRVAKPSPPKKKPLVCRKGFKKRRVHGKQRCVKFEKKRGRR